MKEAAPNGAGATAVVAPHDAAHLLDLPDDLLLSILARLDPLPDAFSAGRTCARLHALVRSDALKVRVSPAPPSTARTPRAVARETFTTLASALASSRPGDTLLLEAGSTHACPALAVDWPLCIQASSRGGDGGGGSTNSRKPTLAATPGSSSALVLNASACLAGLHLTSPPTGGSCLDHRGGTLVVEQCSLTMEICARRTSSCPPVLPCLHSPIVSRAGAPGAGIRVTETRMVGGEAGQAAVRAPGGEVCGVRVIGNLYWLSVCARAWGLEAWREGGSGAGGESGDDGGGTPVADFTPCPPPPAALAAWEGQS